MERSCSCLKSLFPASPIVPEMGVLKGEVGSRGSRWELVSPACQNSIWAPAGTNQLQKAFAITQGATGHGAGVGCWPVGNRQRAPPTHSTSLHTRKHSITAAARAAHTTLPLFHTEAIINTCNNIFPAANSLLQIRTSHSCGGRLCTHGPPLHMQTCTCHTVHTVHGQKSGLLKVNFDEKKAEINLCIKTKQNDKNNTSYKIMAKNICRS